MQRGLGLLRSVCRKRHFRLYNTETAANLDSEQVGTDLERWKLLISQVNLFNSHTSLPFPPLGLTVGW